MNKAYVLLFDGYADWEIGHALAELRTLGDIPVVGVGFTGAAVLSMGGLKVLPERKLSDVDPNDVRIFLLPGGQLWEQAYPEEPVHGFLKSLEAVSAHVAAICGATAVLARAGVLRGLRHTSNSLQYLRQQVAGYDGQGDYVDELAVTDGRVTTASGLGCVEFTRNILEALDIATPQTRASWYRAFKFGEMPAEFD